MTTIFFPFLFLTVGQACRVSVPQREIEPWALTVKYRVLTTGRQGIPYDHYDSGSAPPGVVPGTDEASAPWIPSSPRAG